MLGEQLENILPLTGIIYCVALWWKLSDGEVRVYAKYHLLDGLKYDVKGTEIYAVSCDSRLLYL